ncbi:MAG: hypothetical protein ABIG91_04090 [Patescibacteria group bacterium]
MTIDKARKILGKYAFSMSESQIQELIDSFNQLIEVGFQLFEKEYNQNTFDKRKVITT